MPKKKVKKKRRGWGDITTQGEGKKIEATKNVITAKKKKKSNLKKPCAHGAFFANQEKIHPHSIFSPFWRENILVRSGRKHLNPTIYFHSSIQPNKLKKSFHSYFLSKVFHAPYFIYKQIHPKKRKQL